MPDATPSLFDRVDALTAAGRIADAFALLTGPGAATDADALLCLADWRLSGRFIHRNLATARNLFGHAARLGSTDGLAAYIAFTAGGIGGPADWQLARTLLGSQAEVDPDAVEELALLEAMELTPDGAPARPPEEEILSESPRISCVRRLFSAEECRFLIARALPRLGPSTIVHPATGRQVPDPIRTSDAMAFPFVEESPAIHALNRRIAAATDTAVAQGEPLHVLRYRPGQEYKPHLDALPNERNQRIVTMLVYLNDDYEGGETRFDRTGLTFRGARGDALIFRNIDAAGRPDGLTRHAGLPVTAGEKLLATRWIRSQPFMLPPPRPVLNA
jgi:prolyl 4-hydroxylase